MPARAPLDVDLEDRIIFGLTPQRFGYLVLAGLAAFAVVGEHSWPAAARAALALPLVALGVAAAWGRWHGRPADEYVLDAGRFLLANYTIRLAVTSPPEIALPAPLIPRRDELLPCCTSPGLDEFV